MKQVGHAIRDKQQVKCRKFRATDNAIVSDSTDDKDVDDVIQSRGTTMVENPCLQPNLSVGRNNGVNVQIGDFMSSSSDTTSFDDYQQLSAFPDGDHSTINQNLMPGFNPHRVNLLYQSYLQQYSQSIGDTTLSIPLHWHHLFDNLHNNALRSRLLGNMTNSFLRPENLEPQILSMILRQKAIADALRFSSADLSMLPQTTFSDLTGSQDRLTSTQTERLNQWLKESSRPLPITIYYEGL
jgi:hypothetical protein